MLEPSRLLLLIAMKENEDKVMGNPLYIQNTGSIQVCKIAVPRNLMCTQTQTVLFLILWCKGQTGPLLCLDSAPCMAAEGRPDGPLRPPASPCSSLHQLCFLWCAHSHP